MQKRISKKTSRPAAKIADQSRVRLGHMSPSFAPSKKIADRGKVRLGHMSPSF